MHDQLSFRLRLARQLIAGFTSRKRPGRPVLFLANKKHVPDDVRLAAVGEHFASQGDTYRRCRKCSTRAHEKRTRFTCSFCKVPLCADPCFAKYHGKWQTTWTVTKLWCPLCGLMNNAHVITVITGRVLVYFSFFVLKKRFAKFHVKWWYYWTGKNFDVHTDAMLCLQYYAMHFRLVTEIIKKMISHNLWFYIVPREICFPHDFSLFIYKNKINKNNVYFLLYFSIINL